MRLTDLDKCDRKLFYKQAGGWDSLITAKAAFDMLDSLPVEELPVFKWIPVSERLPEFRKEVLTCSNGGFIEIQSLEDSYDGYWENQKGDWTDLEEITAWMPLPKPYKAESEDKE